MAVKNNSPFFAMLVLSYTITIYNYVSENVLPEDSIMTETCSSRKNNKQ
jgi:hypothetical protein